MEEQAGKRLGRLAVRAGLADLDIEDAELLKAFQAIAARFHGGGKIQAGQGKTANGANGAGMEADQHG